MIWLIRLDSPRCALVTAPSSANQATCGKLPFNQRPDLPSKRRSDCCTQIQWPQELDQAFPPVIESHALLPSSATFTDAEKTHFCNFLRR